MLLELSTERTWRLAEQGEVEILLPKDRGCMGAWGLAGTWLPQGRHRGGYGLSRGSFVEERAGRDGDGPAEHQEG